MRVAVVALAYLGVTALLFRELLPNVRTHLYSYLGDPLLNAAILAWNAAVTPLTEAWWNFPSFAPLTGVTAFTEHLLLTYPLATPIVRLTDNPILAYNVVFLVSPALNGLAAYLLAREITGSTIAAFIGGLAFAFAPYQSAHLAHLQSMWAFGMPLALLGLHRYVAGRKRSGLAWLGAGWLFTAFSNAYALAFFPVLAALWCAWFVRPREWRRLIAPIVTIVLCTLPVLPLLYGYRVRQMAHGLRRDYSEAQMFSADVVGLARMYYRAVPWRGLLPHVLEEGALFPGFVILGLAAIAVRAALTNHDSQITNVTARRLFLTAGALTMIVLARIWTGPWGWNIGPIPLPPFSPYQLFTVAVIAFIAGVVTTGAFRAAWSRRDAVVFWAVAAAVAYLFALGPEPEWSTPWRAIVYGPYRALMMLPGFDSIRVPARMWLPGILCLAMLAAYGVAHLARRYPRRHLVIVALLAAVMVYEGAVSDTIVPAPAPMRDGAIPRGATAIDLPMEESFWNAVPQYRAAVGGYRVVNGYSGYEPAHFLPLRRAIADLNPAALDAYRREGDFYVILRPGETPVVASWIKQRPGIQHLYDTGGAAVYRLPRLAPAGENTVSTR